MLTSRHEKLLDGEGSLVVAIVCREECVGVEAFVERCDMFATSYCDPEFEGDWSAECNATGGGQRGKRCSDVRFRQPGEDAGVSEVCEAGHLLVVAPRLFGGVKVESTKLGKHLDELKP